MKRRSMNIAGILIVAALSFVAGYWPEHQRYLDAVGDLRHADKQVNEAMGRQRVYHLENMLLQALDRAAHKEYDAAQALTTEFFLEVRANMARPDMAQFNPQLKEILEKSDSITAALDKEDQAARDLLRGVMQKLARMASPPPTASEPPAVISVTSAPPS